MDAIGVADAANFPGLIISNSIASFIFVTAIITILFTILAFPLFWLFLWSQYTYFIAILVSMWLNDLIDGYLTDMAYDDKYCKWWGWAGIVDLVHFFLAILGGIGDATNRIIKGSIGLLISLTMVNKPCVPDWVLKIWYLDDFWACY